MISKLVLLLGLVDLEHKIKEDEFTGALKASVEAYEAALDDFQRQKFEPALAKLRPVLAKPTGAEDRKIVLLRYDRQLGRDITTGEHDYYPYQLAARCLLLGAKAEPDKARALEMLKEAKGYLDSSLDKCQADSSRAFQRQVNDAISTREGEVEPSGPTPAEKAAREVRRLIDAGDFVAAQAAIDRQKEALGAQADALKGDLGKAQTKFLGLKWADAEEYLSKFKPTRKIDALVEELRALLPSKVTALSPEFQWVQDFAGALQANREAGHAESIKGDPMGDLVLRAVTLEQFTLLRAAAEVRFEQQGGSLRRAVAAAKSGSLKDVEARSKEVEALLARPKKELEALQAKFPSRKELLERYAEFQSERTPSMEALAADLPRRSEVVQEVIQSLGRCDPAVFGDEAAGGYDALIRKLAREIETPEFSKCHREVQAAGHYLVAALTALEAFRRGDPLSDVRKACEAALKKSRELAPSLQLDLPVSPKVKAALAQ